MGERDDRVWVRGMIVRVREYVMINDPWEEMKSKALGMVIDRHIPE